MLPATTTPRTASKASWIRRTWFTRQLCPDPAAKAVTLDRLYLTKATALRPSWARENRAGEQPPVTHAGEVPGRSPLSGSLSQESNTALRSRVANVEIGRDDDVRR